MEERTGWRGQNESQIGEEKKSGELVGAAETSKERAEWRRLQQTFKRGPSGVRLHTNVAAPINSRLNVLVRSRPRLGWIEMIVGLPERPSYSRHSTVFCV